MVRGKVGIMKIKFNGKISHEGKKRVMRAVAKFLEALADENFSIHDLEVSFDC
jgi:hypothetical protein